MGRYTGLLCAGIPLIAFAVYCIIPSLSTVISGPDTYGLGRSFLFAGLIMLVVGSIMVISYFSLTSRMQGEKHSLECPYCNTPRIPVKIIEESTDLVLMKVTCPLCQTRKVVSLLLDEIDQWIELVKDQMFRCTYCAEHLDKPVEVVLSGNWISFYLECPTHGLTDGRRLIHKAFSPLTDSIFYEKKLDEFQPARDEEEEEQEVEEDAEDLVGTILRARRNWRKMEDKGEYEEDDDEDDEEDDEIHESMIPYRTSRRYDILGIISCVISGIALLIGIVGILSGQTYQAYVTFFYLAIGGIILGIMALVNGSKIGIGGIIIAGIVFFYYFYPL